VLVDRELLLIDQEGLTGEHTLLIAPLDFLSSFPFPVRTGSPLRPFTRQEVASSGGPRHLLGPAATYVPRANAPERC